jgi:hypothetical protein
LSCADRLERNKTQIHIPPNAGVDVVEIKISPQSQISIPTNAGEDVIELEFSSPSNGERVSRKS